MSSPALIPSHSAELIHGWLTSVPSLQGPAVAFPQHQARPTAAPRPAVPVARQPKRVLQLVNPDTNESVDLASVAKEASKLQVRSLPGV